MTAPTQQTVSKLTALLEVRYIYKLETVKENYGKSLFIVILETNCSSLSKELSSMVGKIFQDQTNCLYRIFSFEYAQQQLKDQNLFFVHGCIGSNLIYSNASMDKDLFHQFSVEELLLNRVHHNFKKELDKISSFMEGSDFFLKKGNLSQSVFMLHQFMELLFRNLGLLMMGKERKCHSIKEQQTFIKEFIPELGNLFDPEIEKEQGLLKLLDEAYIATRYGNNYHINKEQIQKIRAKANFLYDKFCKIFEYKLNVCRKEQYVQTVFKTSDPSEPTITEKSIPDSNEKEILTKIKGFAKEHYDLLKPYKYRKGFYTVELLTEGYLNTTFMISNLLKVCILALNANEFPQRLVPEPDHNIQEVLKYILELIPYEEMELLDKLKTVLEVDNLNDTDLMKTI